MHNYHIDVHTTCLSCVRLGRGEYLKGCGIDSVVIDRMKRILSYKNTPRFLGVHETQEYEALSCPARRVAFCAKRFAAKEAFFKSLGTGKTSEISWKDVEIGHTDRGAPTICLTAEGAKFVHALTKKRTRFALSITDERPFPAYSHNTSAHSDAVHVSGFAQALVLCYVCCCAPDASF